MDRTKQSLPDGPEGITPHSCEFCKRIVIDPDKCREDEYGNHLCGIYTFTQVEKAASQGCPMFRRRLEYARLIHRHEISGDAPLGRFPHTLEIHTQLEDNECSLRFTWFDKDGDGFDHTQNEVIQVFALEGSSAADFISMRPLKQDPWSNDNITQVEKRLQECRDYHECCTRQANSVPFEFKPTRVLHVRPGNTDTVFLVDTQGREVRSYAALSYCWGGEERNKLKTERATLAERKKGIEVCLLPKTLQDAVTTARDLGFLYLWIDALCIIQDDENDKATEIKRMSQVYRGASLIISASTAAHCDEGFLRERNLEAQYLDVYQLPWREGSQESIYQTVFCSELPYYYAEADPIDTRAWTMQEHRLARRLLRFGSGQLGWRCKRRDGIEVDGGSTSREAAAQYCAGIDDRIPYEWRDVIEEYTSRCISKWEDRLPAMSAVADEFRHRLGYQSSDYAAGLWKPMLPRMLLWYISAEGEERTCPSQPTADHTCPTWSWQLAPKGIKHGEFFLASLTGSGSLCVEECCVSLKSEGAPFGMVTAGYLVVTGFIEKVLWSGSSLMWQEPGDLGQILGMDVKWDSEIKWLDGQPLYCLEVMEMRSGHSQGLILEKVVETIFRRVGYYSSSPKPAVSTETAQWLRAHSVQRITLI